MHIRPGWGGGGHRIASDATSVHQTFWHAAGLGSGQPGGPSEKLGLTSADPEGTVGYMTQLVVQLPDDRSDDGPAMSCLTEPQRAFVIVMCETGLMPEMANRAAAAAGFQGNNAGWRMMRNPRVLLALKEEAGKRVLGAALIGVTAIVDLARAPSHKDHFKAAKYLAEMNGFTVEQKVTIEHVKKDEREQVAAILAKAAKLGVDPTALLAQAGVIIDAEFEEVDEWSVET